MCWKICAANRLQTEAKMQRDLIDGKCQLFLLYKYARIYYNGEGIQLPAQCAGTAAVIQKKG